MAKSSTRNPVTPDFRDSDKEAVARAQAAIAGGKQAPLVVPKGAKSSTDKKGVTYTRWTERAQIVTAYRSVTESGLLDAVVVVKIRQSEKNTGSRAFGHFYMNVGQNVSDGHQAMNDRSEGAIITLLTATGFMPKGGELKGTLKNKMFPTKGQPGVASPLNNKLVIVNLVQELGPQKNRKTGKPILDDDGEPILEKRDRIESFLPDASPTADDGDDETNEVEEEEEE